MTEPAADPGAAAEAERHGLAVKPGYVTVLDLRTAARERWADLAWDVESGDRM